MPIGSLGPDRCSLGGVICLNICCVFMMNFFMLCQTDFKYCIRKQKLLSHTKRLNLEDRILCTFNINENEYFAQQNKYFHFQIRISSSILANLFIQLLLVLWMRGWMQCPALVNEMTPLLTMSANLLHVLFMLPLLGKFPKNGLSFPTLGNTMVI